MTITKYGKCETCKCPISEKKEVLATIDMFDSTKTDYLRGETLEMLREWRDKEMYCEDHKQ